MSADDPVKRSSVEDLRREGEVLRAENTRLRGLLGRDDRPGAGHTEAWQPTLLTAPVEQPADQIRSRPPGRAFSLCANRTATWVRR